MSAAGRTGVMSLFAGAIVVALFTGLSSAIEPGHDNVVDFMRSQASHGEEAAEPAAEGEVSHGTDVEQLVCFQCHNIERYRSGTTFAHDKHIPMIGHCHKCHAFEGHISVSIREATCDTCH